MLKEQNGRDGLSAVFCQDNSCVRINRRLFAFQSGLTWDVVGAWQGTKGCLFEMQPGICWKTAFQLLDFLSVVAWRLAEDFDVSNGVSCCVMSIYFIFLYPTSDVPLLILSFQLNSMLRHVCGKFPTFLSAGRWRPEPVCFWRSPLHALFLWISLELLIFFVSLCSIPAGSEEGTKCWPLLYGLLMFPLWHQPACRLTS